MAVYHKAFVLIKVKPGHVDDVVDALMKIPEVIETHVVPGQWDILPVLSSPRVIAVAGDEKVYELVMRGISKIKHIQDTYTMVAQFSRTK